MKREGGKLTYSYLNLHRAVRPMPPGLRQKRPSDLHLNGRVEREQAALQKIIRENHWPCWGGQDRYSVTKSGLVLGEVHTPFYSLQQLKHPYRVREILGISELIWQVWSEVRRAFPWTRQVTMPNRCLAPAGICRLNPPEMGGESFVGGLDIGATWVGNNGRRTGLRAREPSLSPAPCITQYDAQDPCQISTLMQTRTQGGHNSCRPAPTHLGTSLPLIRNLLKG